MHENHAYDRVVEKRLTDEKKEKVLTETQGEGTVREELYPKINFSQFYREFWFRGERKKVKGKKFPRKTAAHAYLKKALLISVKRKETTPQIKNFFAA